ncbi:hypothetical protein DFA_10783 [Cavenderia fasciculata]|uniref:Uncharacterized protein n=1 Tax=Cavenderia fasciculata TaxID=261658 RepID=F4QBD8_CACFS|nr:uncharacterized protein DFA_10783 [Cavenderia fasciculata]EGG14910.1 hypothetical protein DFA_10783 [Cavenderia fasciculata]|eukprot:XP_004351426.1 hypothetical protein DFA_10783 [Cavenderia fasciculata]
MALTEKRMANMDANLIKSQLERFMEENQLRGVQQDALEQQRQLEEQLNQEINKVREAEEKIISLKEKSEEDQQRFNQDIEKNNEEFGQQLYNLRDHLTSADTTKLLQDYKKMEYKPAERNDILNGIHTRITELTSLPRINKLERLAASHAKESVLADLPLEDRWWMQM